MINKLFTVSKWAEWDIQIDKTPQEIKSRRLGAPELDIKDPRGQGKQVFASERILKSLPVYQCETITKIKLLVFHDRRSRNEAEQAINTFVKAKGQLGLDIDFRRQSQMIECIDMIGPNKREASGLKKGMDEFLKNNPNVNLTKDLFAIVLLDHQSHYEAVKKSLCEYGVLSQIILKNTARKSQLSSFSNILKQMNTKVGGESLKLKWPKSMTEQLVMVIGIDVCHAGPNSVVGFCASTNNSYTLFYSDIVVQKKNTEIVSTDLGRCLKNAAVHFKHQNKGQLPDRILIYRDGVGEGMRTIIIDKEVSQFKEALADLYNKVSGPPTVTLVIVNKRINQRMFIEGHNGASNPQPGSIIDSILVEHHNEKNCFDFFLVPQAVT